MTHRYFATFSFEHAGVNRGREPADGSGEVCRVAGVLPHHVEHKVDLSLAVLVERIVGVELTQTLNRFVQRDPRGSSFGSELGLDDAAAQVLGNEGDECLWVFRRRGRQAVNGLRQSQHGFRRTSIIPGRIGELGQHPAQHREGSQLIYPFATLTADLAEQIDGLAQRRRIRSRSAYLDEQSCSVKHEVDVAGK